MKGINIFTYYLLCLHVIILYRLFFGSARPINVESIRIMESLSNLESVIKAITVLHLLISDVNTVDVPSGSGYAHILRGLFEYVLNETSGSEFDGYILSTFDCFRKTKQKVVLGPPYKMRTGNKVVEDEDMCDLLMRFDYNDAGAEGWIDETNMRDIINPELLKVFPNVTEIIVRQPQTFSLLKFLSVIKGTSIKSVLFQEITEDVLNTYDSAFGSKILEEYRNAKFAIELFTENNDDDPYETFYEIKITAIF